MYVSSIVIRCMYNESDKAKPSRVMFVHSSKSYINRGYAHVCLRALHISGIFKLLNMGEARYSKIGKALAEVALMERKFWLI